jgi:hypothetical protein
MLAATGRSTWYKVETYLLGKFRQSPFLKSIFLHRVEAMSVLGIISEFMGAIRRLQYVVSVSYSVSWVHLYILTNIG